MTRSLSSATPVPRAALALWATLSTACGSVLDAEYDYDTGTRETAVAQAPPQFLLDVEPASEPDGAGTLLPQTFGPFDADNAANIQLDMQSAATLRGSLLGARVTPLLLSSLPSEQVPVEAALALLSGDGEVIARAHSDAAGVWSLSALTGDYTLAISPADPRIAATRAPVSLLDDSTTSITLDPGAPLWGQVVDGNGAPVSGAQVYARGGEGEPTTADTTTDAGGWYELRVSPGTWSVTTSGDPSGRQPILHSTVNDVPANGLRVDIPYITTTRAGLSLRLVDADGDPVSGVPVRVRSQSIDGYPADLAEYAVSLSTDSRGYIDTRVPAGVYQIDAVPEPESQRSAAALSGVVVSDNVDLPALTLATFVEHVISVTDAQGVPLPDANVRVTETISGRSWNATVDDQGFAIVGLPDGPTELVLTPPGARADLAGIRLRVDAGQTPASIALPAGEPITGRVSAAVPGGSAVLAYAVVRLRELNGDVWAWTLTDEEGSFTLRVAWESLTPTNAP